VLKLASREFSEEKNINEDKISKCFGKLKKLRRLWLSGAYSKEKYVDKFMSMCSESLKRIALAIEDRNDKVIENTRKEYPSVVVDQMNIC
jgi:hypothetical protein